MSLLLPLLGADGASSFRRDVWQQRSAVVASHGEQRLDDWLGVRDVDDLVGGVDFPAANLDLADGTQPLPKTLYAGGGGIDRTRVLALHQEGATIILRAAHRWSPRLRRLCAALEWDFGFPVQANVYVTPAGRQSTPPHWDTHDLFILQVAGSKRWRLYESTYEAPLDDQRFDADVYGVGAELPPVDLASGDVFYLPRGTIHEPVAQERSIHVSLGVLVSRWADVLAAVVHEVSRRHRDLREVLPLPAGELGTADRHLLAMRLTELAKELADPAACAAAVQTHLDGVVARHGEPRSGSLLASPESALVRRRASTYVVVDDSDDRLAVRWSTGSCSVPSAYAPLLRRLLGDEVVDARDARLPGDPEERRVLVDALVEQGLLERVDER